MEFKEAVAMKFGKPFSKLSREQLEIAIEKLYKNEQDLVALTKQKQAEIIKLKCYPRIVKVGNAKILPLLLMGFLFGVTLTVFMLPEPKFTQPSYSLEMKQIENDIKALDEKIDQQWACHD